MDETAEIVPAPGDQTIEKVVEIVSAYVAHNPLPISELPGLIATTHAAIIGLTQPTADAEPEVGKPTSAQIRKSITPDALISFIDGKGYKTLKRHLSTHGLTIEAYRDRYGLPRDYPSTSANYSAQRSELARDLGLGQQRRSAAAKVAASAETISAAPKSRGQKGSIDVAAKPAPARKSKAKAAE